MIISRRLLMAALLLPVGASAQWINYTPAGVPLLKNGKVNLAAPVPKAPNGKPDLTGVWLHEKSTLAEFRKLLGPDYDPAKQSTLIGMENEAVHKYGFNILIDLKPGEAPLTPAAEAFMKQKFAERRTDNVCHGEYGWPVLGLLAEPLKIVQAPKETVILYEIDGMHRQVFVDGRKFPAEFQLPAYLGYSVGRWEGDTFVIETRGFNDRTPLDAVGHPRSEEMHVTERFRRRDYGHLDTEMTFNDPVMYKTPFTVKISYELQANNDIFEMYCGENEKDRAHMTK
ncbi:MAG: hypothetical protein ABIR70_18570 [Bryobacteraceae bacterium]